MCLQTSVKPLNQAVEKPVEKTLRHLCVLGASVVHAFLGGIPPPSHKKHDVTQRPEKRPIAVLLDRIRDLSSSVQQ
jgi:hypothetical protein